MNDCKHTIMKGRKDEKGSWCESCGIKVYEVETRECGGCVHYSRVIGGSICSKHLMAVLPSMLVTFKLESGTCFDRVGSSKI